MTATGGSLPSLSPSGRGIPPRRGLAALIVPLVALAAAPAVPAAPSGEEIAREADRRQETTSQFYQGDLKVVDRKGKVREKAWMYWRQGYGGDSKTVIQFTSPPEVAGVGLLTWVHEGREDEQWMWTPAIRRDRRIAPQEKSTRFLGTDFTYEDLSQRVLEDWRYRLEEEVPCQGGRCWVVKAVPRAEKKSQYSFVRIWFRQSDYATMRMEMTEGEDMRRILELSGHREVSGVVTPHHLVMSDLKRGSRTELAVSGVRYGLPFQESLFTLRSLREIHAPPE